MVHAVLQRDPKWRGASLAQVEKQVAKLDKKEATAAAAAATYKTDVDTRVLYDLGLMVD